MLEFDGQPLDPAIVSAQPMKSAQMVCGPGKVDLDYLKPIVGLM